MISKQAATHVPQVVDGLCDRAGLDRATLRRAALHPSSGAAIRSQCDALGLDDHSLDVNLDELRRHGNTSGPSVLMALEALLETTPSSGEPLLVLGSGPGYCIESVLLSW